MESISDQFKKRRIQLGISLNRVHVDTHISNSCLDALESNKFEVFSAEVYLTGFIRKYASYLGMDPDALIAQHRVQKSIDKQRMQMKEIEQQKASVSNENSLSIQRYIFLTSVVMLCFGIFVSLLFLTKKKEPVFKEVKEVEAKRFLSSVQNKSKKRIPLELLIKAVNKSWIRVESDGIMVFEGILPQEKSEHWKAKRDFKIIAQNWDDIVVKLNGSMIAVEKDGVDTHKLKLDRSFLKKDS